MSDLAAVHCTDHPDLELVRAHRPWAPIDRQADQRKCPSPDHPEYRSGRCAHCGGPLTGRRAYASVYCGTRCRVAALRARRSVTLRARAQGVTPSPGPNAGVKSAPGETVQEVQE